MVLGETRMSEEGRTGKRKKLGKAVAAHEVWPDPSESSGLLVPPQSLTCPEAELLLLLP